VQFASDVVVVDLQMPEPDGLERWGLARRSKWAGHSLPLIELAGKTANVARNNDLLQGDDDFLTESIDRHEVELGCVT
jgi:DNA-binding response OmpR family regulator